MLQLRLHFRGYDVQIMPRSAETLTEFQQIPLQPATRSELMVNETDAHGEKKYLNNTFATDAKKLSGEVQEEQGN
jgi:hypothetical protein